MVVRLDGHTDLFFAFSRSAMADSGDGQNLLLNQNETCPEPSRRIRLSRAKPALSSVEESKEATKIKPAALGRRLSLAGYASRQDE